jgi:uncharacterized membrane protein YdjX (TVP38/TMEM64 family)
MTTGARPGLATWVRWSLAASTVLLLALVWYSGALDGWLSIERLRALFSSLGPWGYVLFVASFALLQPVGVPALIWLVAAGIIWPFWVAFSLSLAAAALAGSIAFLIARHIARDWVAARMPTRLKQYDDRLEAHGLISVIVLRLVMRLNPATPWVLGLSRVRFDRFLLGSVIGSVPSIAMATYFGAQALEWAEENPVLFWSGVATLAVLAIGVQRVVVLRARAKEGAAAH